MHEGLIQIDGDWWPKDDKECRPAVMRTYKDADHALALCNKFDVAVQAGGNCGIWPRYLAKKFSTVYTFEPELMNFLALNLNVPDQNVIRIQAALGDKARGISMIDAGKNIGAHRVGSKGMIPVMRIDDMRLTACDLLQLDIEGYEVHALRGAVHTIDNCKPVIMLEDKGHHLKYGLGRNALNELLETLGYVIHGKINRDVIWVPRERLQAA